MDKSLLKNKYKVARTINRKIQCEVMEEVIHHVGGLPQLAELLGETKSNLCLWRYGNRNVRPSAAVILSLLFKIDPSHLRPDIFPKETTIIVGDDND
jgi:DNA-binding transcriptional regulator YdaS (Cro superfamily)